MGTFPSEHIPHHCQVKDVFKPDFKKPLIIHTLYFVGHCLDLEDEDFWRNKMNYKRLDKDRSGVSVILVLVVVAIVVIAAAAAYVVLSGDDKEVEYGVGTTYNYSVSGDAEAEGTATITLLGQNKSQYFVQYELEVEIDLGELYIPPIYTLIGKNNGAPADAKKVGTERVETIDGTKTLDVWESVVDGTDVKAKSFIDPETGIEYRAHKLVQLDGEIIVLVLDMTSKELVEPTEYEESENIGKIFKYTMTLATGEVPYEVECVADCIDGQFGMLDRMTMEDGTLVVDYILADTPQGLYAGSEKSKETHEHEGVTYDIWTYSDPLGVDVLFLVNPDTGIIQVIQGYVGTVLIMEAILDE